jgi:site-specific DNA recombinase
LRVGQDDLETQRQQSLATLQHRRRAVQAKLDRSYDDHLEGRITEEFWSRKSAEWNTELTVLAAEINRLEAPIASPAVTAERILELAKRAVFLYEKQDRAEQRKLLEILLSNCTFDRGSVCATYTSPFDLFVRGNETEDWRRGWDSNPRALLRQDAFEAPPL